MMKDNIFVDPFASNTTNNNMASSSTNAHRPNSYTADSIFYGNSPTSTDASDFFAEFNNNFNKNKYETTAFNAFGETNNKVSTDLITTTKPSTSKFKSEHFEDEFARIKIKNDLDDFARLDAFSTVHGISKSSKDTFSDSHAAFDTVNKPKKEKTDAGRTLNLKNPKFEADYSKGDTFEEDLNEILKRSLMDQ